MDGHYVIPILSPMWILGLVLSVLYIGGALYMRRFLKTETQQNLPAFFGKALLLFLVFIYSYYWVASGVASVKGSLPLQLCAIMQFICVFALIYKNQLAFEFTLLLGIPAAMHSIATPEMTHGYDGVLLFDYYFSHASQILAPLVLYYYCGMRPAVQSWRRVFLMVNVLLIFVFCIDWLIGANYIYLMEKPSVDNPLLIGPWPWYIIGVEIAGLIHILLFYWIFRKTRWFAPKLVEAG